MHIPNHEAEVGGRMKDPEHVGGSPVHRSWLQGSGSSKWLAPLQMQDYYYF